MKGREYQGILGVKVGEALSKLLICGYVCKYGGVPKIVVLFLVSL